MCLYSPVCVVPGRKFLGHWFSLDLTCLIHQNKLREIMVSLVWFLINVPVNHFSVMWGRSHRFLGIHQYFGLAQGNFMAIMVSVCVLIKSAASRANLS